MWATESLGWGLGTGTAGNAFAAGDFGEGPSAAASNDVNANAEQDREPRYYVNVPNAEESTRKMEDRAVNIDPDFESTLQERMKIRISAHF